MFDGENKLIWDGMENYPVLLSAKVLKMCEVCSSEKLRVTEFRELILRWMKKMRVDDI